MNKSIFTVWKPIGWTPLQSIQEFKRTNPEYRNETISYAGRLDPMAEGALLLLVGDENKKRKEYENLKKEYETEIVLGISTDTFDSLGLVQKSEISNQYSKKELTRAINSFLGKQLQKYPPYSSKPVNGKPLYWWARRDKISEIEIPSHEVEIYDIVDGGWWMVDGKELANKTIEKIKIVEGDFRQEEIIKAWQEFGKLHSKEEFQVLKLNISCSSGTYIRRLASDLGEKLGTGAFALSIKRTRVGDFNS